MKTSADIKYKDNIVVSMPDTLGEIIEIEDFVTYSQGEYNNLNVGKVAGWTKQKIKIYPLMEDFTLSHQIIYLNVNAHRFMKVPHEKVALAKMSSIK